MIYFIEDAYGETPPPPVSMFLATAITWKQQVKRADD
jgi:hypothetical protein